MSDEDYHFYLTIFVLCLILATAMLAITGVV